MEHNDLPKEWITTPIKTLFSFVLGGDWGKDPLKFKDKDYELALCIRGSEIKNWETKNSSTAVERLIKKPSLEKRTLIPGDVLIEISGGGPDQPVGRTIYIDKNSLINDKDIPLVCTNFLRMMRFHPSLNSKYIQQYLQLFYDSGSIIKYQGGSNNLRNLKFRDFETIKIPIAPRPEQVRIVAKVDILMTQVETIKKSLERIPQLLKDFRQQVLTQAVTGKLTEEWRTVNNIKEWEEDKFKNLVDYDTGPAFKSKEFTDTGIKLLRGQNIEPRALRWKDVKYFDKSKLENLKNLFINEGDVILAMDRPIISTGLKVAIAKKKDLPCVLVQRVCRFKETNRMNNKFLYYIIKSRKFISHLFQNQTGTQIPHISGKQILAYKLFIPAVQEQKEIVRRVESLFTKADAIEQQYQSLKTNIDTLPQAILHKAFKGELVEQLDSDGDARDLLSEIHKLKTYKK
ncbi:MAG: restriction endonuclease subunit S [Arenibacter algicola]